MTTRRERLRAIFDTPLAETLASAAPLLLVATASGSVIGTALALPGFAASPFGTLGLSLAANLVTSMVYDLIKPDLDDAARTNQIAQALEAHDPASGALVAATLIEAGPEVAQALLADRREALIGGLEAGMQQAGGPLAQIAPRYAAGLRDPQTDWAALQAALRQTVEQTAMLMQVGHEGAISDVEMRADGTKGTVDMRMIAGDKGKISGARMVRTGGGPAPSTAVRRCPDCGAAVALTRTTCPHCGQALGPAR